jgi:hypothetical protein
MDSLIDLLRNSGTSEQQALMLVLLLVTLPLLALFTMQQRAGKPVALRPIQAFHRVREFIGRGAETGRPIHVSLGTGGIADASTAESLAGVTFMGHIAGQSIASGAPLIVTVSDPTLLPLAQETALHAWESRQYGCDAAEPEVRLVAPEPVAYAAGVMDTLLGEHVAANVMVGKFGHEYLLMGETGIRTRTPQIAGGIDPQTLPFIQATADEVLIGEEIFASGAYLNPKPTHIASLRVQDWLRVLVTVVILVGVILRSV